LILVYWKHKPEFHVKLRTTSFTSNWGVVIIMVLKLVINLGFHS